MISRLRMSLDNVLARNIDDLAFNLSDNEVVSRVRERVGFDGLAQ